MHFSDNLLEAPIILVGLTALSEEIKINFSILDSKEISHKLFVPIKLLLMVWNKLNSLISTCL